MTHLIPSLAEFSAEKRRVALHSMLAAAAMTVLKLAAGLVSGSLGVLSDAAHSGLDLVGVTLTYFSVQRERQAGRRGPHIRPRQDRESLGIPRSGADGRLVRVDYLGGDAGNCGPHRGAAPLNLAGGWCW